MIERAFYHVGHSLTVAVYGNVNIAIECEDCNEVVWEPDCYGVCACAHGRICATEGEG